MTDAFNSCCQFQDSTLLRNSCGAQATLFMTFVEMILQSQLSISDACNRLKLVEQPEDRYDFIVVGAGISGSVVASRLSEISRWKVLLLEAGSDEPTAAQVPGLSPAAFSRTDFSWNYTTEPQDNACLRAKGICNWPRGKSVGGTGIINGMMYTRGNAKDYDAWAEAGNVGWSYEDVLPYFIKSENNGNPELVEEEYHGFNGLLPVQQLPYQPELAHSIIEAAVELGYPERDVNGRNKSSFAVAQLMYRNGVRVTTASAFLRPFRNRSNLDVTTNARVTKVLIDRRTLRAVGVEYIKNNEFFKVKARKEIILSAGAINSPQLLLLSGVGPQEDLESLDIKVLADLSVGRNLHNHVAARVRFSINEYAIRQLSMESLYQYVNFLRGPLASTGLSQLTGFVKSKYAEEDYPDLQIFFSGYSTKCSNTGLIQECENGSMKNCGRREIAIRPTLVDVRSKGVLKLRSSNPLDHPLLFPNYLTKKQDINILKEGIQFALKMSRTKALKAWGMQAIKQYKGCENFEYGTDDYWECVIVTHTGAEHHQSGTAKMGPSYDPEAVVDPQLRVYRITSLRVIDASIFPMLPRANPVSSLVMIAEKGSDMIKRTWLKKL